MTRKARPLVMCGDCGRIFLPNKRHCPNCKEVEERNKEIDI